MSTSLCLNKRGKRREKNGETNAELQHVITRVKTVSRHLEIEGEALPCHRRFSKIGLQKKKQPPKIKEQFSLHFASISFTCYQRCNQNSKVFELRKRVTKFSLPSSAKIARKMHFRPAPLLPSATVMPFNNYCPVWCKGINICKYFLFLLMETNEEKA